MIFAGQIPSGKIKAQLKAIIVGHHYSKCCQCRFDVNVQISSNINVNLTFARHLYEVLPPLTKREHLGKMAFYFFI